MQLSHYNYRLDINMKSLINSRRVNVKSQIFILYSKRRINITNHTTEITLHNLFNKKRKKNFRISIAFIFTFYIFVRSLNKKKIVLKKFQLNKKKNNQRKILRR